MDRNSPITLRDVSATTGTLAAFAMVALLIASGTATDEVLAASGVLNEFMDAGDVVVINFTKVAGGDNTDHSLRLPKQSNVVDAKMNVTGSDIFISNQIKTFKSAFDFRQGTQTNLMYDTYGLHLDMDTLAPFWPYEEKATGSNSYDVATGDFNDDGRPDIAVVNRDGDSITVYYQNNQGKMSSKTTHSTSNDPVCIDVGDFNDDDRDDLAIGCYIGKAVDFLTQKATGGFTKTSKSVAYYPLGIATGDLNGDGLDDVALATEGKYGVTLVQSASGTFSVGQTIKVGVSTGSYYYQYDVRDVAVADFDEDGLDDVVWSSCGRYSYNYDYQRYGQIRFYYQDSAGSLVLKRSIWGYTGAWYIDAGNMNSDSRPDIVISQRYVNKIKVFYQSANGAFSGPKNLGGDGVVYRMVVADFNGDGANDLAAGTSKPSLLLYKNVEGTLSTQAKKFDLPDDSAGMGIAAGDFNGDGYVDAVVACERDNSAAIFLQRLSYDGSYVSQALKQPLPVRYVNFSYNIIQNGGETHFLYSKDGGTNWTEVANGTFVDLEERTNTLWFKLTFHSSSASDFNAVKWVALNLTYQSYPSNLLLDLGRDSITEWNMTGELQGSTLVVDLKDALTDYIKDSSHYPDSQGYVTIPIYLWSKTPGTLQLSDLYILYNNASRKPEIVFPEDRGFVNATPTLYFVANDTDDDLLKYRLQISKGGDFNDGLKTMTFDMRFDLFDQEEREGFPEAVFPEGVVASFKLPELFSLEDDTTYSWRVMAHDGYLMSKSSPVYLMRVDSFAPTGHASTPRYSTELNFTVIWSAEDVMPGSGLAPLGTYDIQYRKSTEPTWTDWLTYSTKTSAMFQSEEGVTYYFRMRSRDTVWNEQLFIGGKGDTQTTVDSRTPIVTFTDMPGFQDTRTFLVRWIGEDYEPGSGIRHYDVQVRKEDGPWTEWLSEFKGSQSVYTADSDKTYHFRIRAVDYGGNVGDWSEVFSVRIDATPPVLQERPRVPLDGADAWTDLDSLTVEFAFIDTELNVRSVEVAVGTESGLLDVMPPTVLAYPEDGVLILRDLPLINSFTYFVGVKAENQAGAWSDWSWSDGVLVAIPGPVSTLDYPEGRISEIEVPIDITVEDHMFFNVTLGDLRMRSATRTDEVWAWTDWARISNAREDVIFEGKRGFRYQFKYRAQNELGSWGEFVEYDDDYFVFINNPPVANGGPAQITTIGESVQFSADESEDRDGDALEYVWDFGDGTTSIELLPNHEYDKAGLYTVTLMVTDGYETSTARVTVYVEEQEQTPGFGPLVTMVALLVAVLVAVSASGRRRR